MAKEQQTQKHFGRDVSQKEIELISNIQTIFGENERLTKKLETQKEEISNQLQLSFSSNILYWVDGYKQIVGKYNLSSEQSQSLIGDIMEHQREFIKRVCEK